jgi:hypothetical protein
MIRILMTTAALIFSAGVAHAGEFRVGAGNVASNFDLEHDSPYFDTYPGAFCGTKAIRLQILNHHTGGTVHIGRVYYAYQQPAEHGPFSAYVKVNATLREGQTTGWIPVPNMGSCLKKVRVYAEGNDFGGWEHGSHRVVVIGHD